MPVPGRGPDITWVKNAKKAKIRETTEMIYFGPVEKRCRYSQSFAAGRVVPLFGTHS